MTDVMIGVDGSEASRRAVDFAIEIAKEFELEVVVVHVIPWTPYSFSTPDENEHRHNQRKQELKAANDQIIDPALHRLALSQVKAEGLVKHGHPVEVMIDLAVAQGVRHIIVGRTGDSRIKQVLFGSTPSQLIISSPVPVTVVP